MSEHDEPDDLPTAHPAFAAHFTSPFYDDPSDELGPFGSDEGWELLAEWGEQRDELDQTTTLVDLLERSDFAGAADAFAAGPATVDPQAPGVVDAATIVVSAAFTLLRLTGQIDEQGRTIALCALDTLLAAYDAPDELVQQRQDLQAWRG